MLYIKIGAYAKAEPFLQRALAIFEKVVGTEHLDTAKSLINLAGLYGEMGLFTKAEQLIQRALAIHTKVLGPESPKIATDLNILAIQYQQTGSYTNAKLRYEQALAIQEKALGSDHSETADSLNNLAALHQLIGDYATAEPLLQRALEIQEKLLGPEHPNIADSLSNLSALYDATGAAAKAKILAERALAIREKVFGVEHPHTADSLHNLASHYLQTDDLLKAEPLLHRALAINEKARGPEHPRTANSLNQLALFYWHTGNHNSAESLYERAQNIYEANVVRFLLFGSESRKQAYLRQQLQLVYSNISFSLAHPTLNSKALGLTSVLQYKGRVLDAMSNSGVWLRRSVASEDRALFDQLSTVAQEFSTLTFRGPEKMSSGAYRERLDTLAQEQERVQAELSSRSTLIRQAVMPITLNGVRQALPEDTVLVEFFRYVPFDPKAAPDIQGSMPQYVAYVLKSTDEPVAIDLGAAQPIEELIPAFRTALSDPASDYYKEAAKSLFEKLIKPLLPHLTQNERLLLSPDGALNLVPFAALVDERCAHLLEQFEITYLTSGRDLLRMATETSSRETTMLVADPNYGDPPSGGLPVEAGLEPKRSVDLDRGGLVFTKLEGATKEAAALQSLLKLDARRVLTGDDATEAKLRELHGPGILHMATHGFFLNDLQMKATLRRFGFGFETAALPLGENPLLRSGLALAGANARYAGETDDGILTAAEVAQLDLLGTQLVVLSACETGLGTVQNGEGVYGLRRALVLAGAQTQVVSLWKVRDTAARELMVDYYQRLLQGEGRSGALRAAQKAMMANPARQHPCLLGSLHLHRGLDTPPLRLKRQLNAEIKKNG